MIDPKGDVFRWGPIDSKIAYTAFLEFLADVGNHLVAGWPDIMGYFKNNKILFLGEYPALKKNGLVLFEKITMDEAESKKYFDLWQNSADKIVKLQKDIEGLEGLSDGELTGLFESWYDNYGLFWRYGSIPELANWGGEQLLKDKLPKLNQKEFLEVFEKLSAPEDLSFYQKEELDLFVIKGEKDVVVKEKLKEHQKKYYWLRNSYGHEEVLSVKYFEDALSEISEEKAREQIEEIKSMPGETISKKKEIIEKYKLSGEIAMIGARLAHSIWWQDHRKKFIFMAVSQIERFVSEINRRLNIDKKELYNYMPLELLKLLKDGTRVDNAVGRLKGYVDYYHEGKGMEQYFGEDINKIMEPFLNVDVDNDVREFNGLPVCRGIARGVVKIILSPLKMTKMNFGDILVTPMTSPDFILAMKKAAAIVTDVGGMTSHAAIVSREMKTPCIVGTKVATRVLKDGDLVEVNANHGVVRILEKGQ